MAWVRLGMHPNIIWAMWVIDVGAKPYLVMEYADSGDLHEWITATKEGLPRARGKGEGVGSAASRRLTIPLTLNFALQFCEGMKHAATTSGLVHRDIKPANVLIKDNRILKITDFGLAKAHQDLPSPASPAGEGEGKGSNSYDLSAAGAGTRAYMAPEQFRSLRLADTRSDIFSFGAMLYEMLTRLQPFAVVNAAEMARRGAAIPGAHEMNPAVPPDLSAIVAQCLAYDPGRRYQSFDELHAALSAVSEVLSDKLAIPTDEQHAARAPLLTPSLEIVGETYSLISLGCFAEAAACAQRGIDIAPTDFQHWVNKGKALSELGDFFVRHTKRSSLSFRVTSARRRPRRASPTWLGATCSI
jgi:serine/threonine protein kinase